jgi:hypothetical protein
MVSIEDAVRARTMATLVLDAAVVIEPGLSGAESCDVLVDGSHRRPSMVPDESHSSTRDR